MAWSLSGCHVVLGLMPWRVADRPRDWRSADDGDLPFVSWWECLECERSRCVLCGRDADLECCLLLTGFSGGSIFVGTSIGGGVVSMAVAAEWTTAGTFGGNDGVIIVHVDVVSMKGGVVTDADADE